MRPTRARLSLDARLKNKDEVLGLVFPQHPDRPMAISASYLAAHPLYLDEVGGLRFVVLTDDSGANRVYEAADVTFTAWDGETGVQDATGRNWSLQEATLVSEDGAVLHRLPAQRAFRFGWFSAYNHTRLVQ